VGPVGFVVDPAPFDNAWPGHGAPKYGLIARIRDDGTPFYVGSASTITVNRDGGPFMLSLGPNDSWVGDNNGDFDCVAVLYASA
jgi:hypothetical protein